MSKSNKSDTKAQCAKQGGISRAKLGDCWTKWLLPLAGLVALIWFLVRVLPKPSRAAYPCQRVAAPLASGFVAWLLGVVASVWAARKAKQYVYRSRYVIAGLCVALSVGALWLVLSISEQKPVLADAPVPNAPLGVAKGVHPGRVVWVHDPEATDWDGPGDGHWWESTHTNQAVVDRMLSQALRALTGEASDAAAWDRLFRHFNKTHGKGNVGYQPGQKIAIKVNFVGFIYRWDAVNPQTYDLQNRRDYMNTSPQMMLALLGQLVQTVGVEEADISIGDSLAYFANEYYNILHDEFPHVHYLDHAGKFGRTAVKQSSVPLYWSCRPQGCRQDYVPASFARADYLINLANLKSHTAAGVTLCAKNHYGSLVRWPVQEGYYDLHISGFPSRMGEYRALVDLMGHAHIGGKTLLYLIDGLYPGRHPIDKAPRKWDSPPFDGDWASSLFASQDPVAIDSVAFDFLWAAWDDYPHKAGADDYLHEAAQANDPPSGTFYDPDHAGNVTRLASLGVHEHWNNPLDKQYSRNLGTGKGIELVAVAEQPEAARKSVDDWIALLEGSSPPALRKEAIQALRGALADEAPLVRVAAADALGDLGPEAAPAVPALISGIEDEEPYVRAAASEALGKIGRAAVPALLEAFQTGHLSLRVRSCVALGGIGPQAKDAVPAMAKAIEDPNPLVRRIAARSLGQIGPKARQAVPALVKALEDEDRSVRDAAAVSLGELGPHAKEAIPALEAALEDQDETVRKEAARALKSIR